MSLLYANDARGRYPDSWYAATTDQLGPFPTLNSAQRADLCVIGAGYTGLSTALHAANAGLDVVIVDAQRVGFGASGRNGGQVGSGFNQDQRSLEKLLGAEAARRLYELGQDAAELTRHLVATCAPEANYRSGLVHACCTQGELDDAREEVAHLQNRYGSTQVSALPQEALREIVGCDDFVGGVLDANGGHLHPLRYAIGLARACAAAGVRIFENSQVEAVKSGQVTTSHGSIAADHIVIATNGYGTELSRPTREMVMPINNFIAATEPLGDLAEQILSRDVAVYDSSFVVNYFRLSEDKRLLFGGGESYGYRFPSDIAATVRKPMIKIFPALKDVGIDYAWGGTLAITRSRLPYVAKIAPGVISASGYSGSGVALAGLVGKLLAGSITAQNRDLDLLAALPSRRFPGGGSLRSPLLVLAMSWYALRDRLGA